MHIDGGLHVPAKEASEKFAPTRGACTSEASGHWVKLKWPATVPSCDSASVTDIATKPRAPWAAAMLQPGPCNRHDRAEGTMASPFCRITASTYRVCTKPDSRAHSQVRHTLKLKAVG